MAPNRAASSMVSGIGQARWAIVEGALTRVVDSGGVPLDDGGPVRVAARLPLNRSRINPVHRAPTTRMLDVGVRAIYAR